MFHATVIFEFNPPDVAVINARGAADAAGGRQAFGRAAPPR